VHRRVREPGQRATHYRALATFSFVFSFAAAFAIAAAFAFADAFAFAFVAARPRAHPCSAVPGTVGGIVRSAEVPYSGGHQAGEERCQFQL
jgi:hypothetical protein